MKRAGRSGRPRWWILYGMGVGLIGLIAVVETGVPPGGLRSGLEIAAVIGVFRLMAIWIRRNHDSIRQDDLWHGRGSWTGRPWR